MKNVNIFIFILITFSVFYSGCDPANTEGSVIEDCVTCTVRTGSTVILRTVMCNQNSIDKLYEHYSEPGYTVDCQ